MLVYPAVPKPMTVEPICVAMYDVLTRFVRFAVDTRPSKLAVETKLVKLAVDTKPLKFAVLTIDPKTIVEI